MATGPPHRFEECLCRLIPFFFPLFGRLFLKRKSTHRCPRLIVVFVVVVGAGGELRAEYDERRRAGLESRSGCGK